MAFNALEERNIAQIQGMLEGLVRFMAKLALVVGQPSKINRVLERPGLRVFFGRSGRIIDYCVADIAIIPDYLSGIAHVLAIVATEATRRIEVANVVGMRLPICLHLREKISLKDALDFFAGDLYRLVLI